MRKSLLLCGLLIISLVLPGCKTPSNNGKTQTTLGAVLPLTGPIASYGINSKSGVDLALEEINTPDGLNIKVIYEDDAGEAKNAVSGAQKLISTDRVPLIIGGAASGFSVAMAPICNQNRVVLFSPVSSAAELTEKGGEYFFRVCPSDAFQARILAKWLLDDGRKAISLLYVNNNWGVSLKDEFIRNYEPNGGKILATEAGKEGDRDFKSQLQKINVPEAQAVVAFTPPKEGGPVVRQSRELGLSKPLYGGDFWGTPEFLESAGEAGDGVFFTFPATPKGAKYDEFVQKYRSKYGKDPDIYASYAYDQTHIIANAIRAGANTGEKFKDYLRAMAVYDGVTGPTKFDEHGDVITKTFDRKTIKNRQYVVIE